MNAHQYDSQNVARFDGVCILYIHRVAHVSVISHFQEF